MDSFEFNKVAGAVLGTALGVMALGIISEMIYEPGEPAKPGYAIEVTETSTAPAEAAAAVAPIAVRLQTADASKGAQVAKKCLACHTLNKGEPAKVGPNLYGVLGGPAAHMAGFKYSQAMLDFKGKGGTWTFDNLDHFLTSPKGFIPGTLMTFPGLPSPTDRANVIAYVRTLSDSPVALPDATAAAAPAAGAAPAPADGATPPAATPAPPAPADQKAPAPAAEAPKTP